MLYLKKNEKFARMFKLEVIVFVLLIVGMNFLSESYLIRNFTEFYFGVFPLLFVLIFQIILFILKKKFIKEQKVTVEEQIQFVNFNIAITFLLALLLSFIIRFKYQSFDYNAYAFMFMPQLFLIVCLMNAQLLNIKRKHLLFIYGLISIVMLLLITVFASQLIFYVFFISYLVIGYVLEKR